MSNQSLSALLAAMAVLGACSDSSSGPGGGGPTADVTVLSAAGRASSVLASIGGQTAESHGAGGVSDGVGAGGEPELQLPGPGERNHRLRRHRGPGGGGHYLLIAQDSQGVVVGSLVADTGAIVPAGNSKLRI